MRAALLLCMNEVLCCGHIEVGLLTAADAKQYKVVEGHSMGEDQCSALLQSIPRNLVAATKVFEGSRVYPSLRWCGPFTGD